MTTEEEPTLLEKLVAQSGDPEIIPGSVMQAYRAGRIKAARALLIKHSKTERNGVRKQFQEQVLRELRYWVKPGKAPTMYTLNGVGSMLYGNYQQGEDGLHIATLWFTIVFIPFFPISAYLVAKAEEGGYYFFGKAPLPPVARFMRGLVGAGILGSVLIGMFGAFMATTHTDVIAWNGFDVPLEVAVADVTATIPPHSPHTFDDVAAEAVMVSATAGDQQIEQFEADLNGTSSDTVIYNVGSRGVHEKLWVRYGEGDPPDGDLISGGPIIVLEDIDYPFTEAPDEKSVEVGSYIDNTILESLDGDIEVANLMMLLIEEDRTEDGLAMMASEFLVNPDVHLYAPWITQMALEGDVAAGKAWLRPLLDAHGQSVDLHRSWQELHTGAEKDALQAEYRTRLEAAPESADAMYLLARLLDAREAEAITLLEKAVATDAEHERSWGTLGWNRSIAGDYKGALAAYNTQLELNPDEFDSIQSELVRLAALTGASRDAQLEVADEGFPEGMTSWLGAHLSIAARPSKADQIIEAWAGEDEVDVYLLADMMLTAGRLDSARTYIAQSEERLGVDSLALQVPLRLAMSDGATEADRAAASALLVADELPVMSEDTQIKALAFAIKNGLDAVPAIEALLASSDLAVVIPGLAQGADLEAVNAEIGALGLRQQAAAAAAVSHVLTGKAKAQWRGRASKLATPDELPAWK
jgi:tetratricopeptide (TPR) repeat protein